MKFYQRAVDYLVLIDKREKHQHIYVLCTSQSRYQGEEGHILPCSKYSIQACMKI
jgi:hypothetical protein